MKTSIIKAALSESGIDDPEIVEAAINYINQGMRVGRAVGRALRNSGKYAEYDSDHINNLSSVTGERIARYEFAEADEWDWYTHEHIDEVAQWHGTCWSSGGEFSVAPRVLALNDGYAYTAHRRQRVSSSWNSNSDRARCWVLPYDCGCELVFNGYGPFDNVTAKMAAQLAGQSDIRHIPDIGYGLPTMYVNNNAYLIGPRDCTGSHGRGYRDEIAGFDHMIEPEFEQCAACGDHYETEDMIEVREDGRPHWSRYVCNDCVEYSDRVYKCDSCGYVCYDQYNDINGMTVCIECTEQRFSECGECGELTCDDEMRDHPDMHDYVCAACYDYLEEQRIEREEEEAEEARINNLPHPPAKVMPGQIVMLPDDYRAVPSNVWTTYRDGIKMVMGT